MKVLWKAKIASTTAYALTYSSDSKYLFVAGKNEVSRLDASNGEQVKLLKEPLGVGGDNYLFKTKGSHAR